jgi:hypothetical protein
VHPCQSKDSQSNRNLFYICPLSEVQETDPIGIRTKSEVQERLGHPLHHVREGEGEYTPSQTLVHVQIRIRIIWPSFKGSDFNHDSNHGL